MTSDFEGAPDRSQLTHSLAEQIATRLSDRIVSGEYTPGQRIMEQALAAEFGVSRGPVREALRLLEKDGLVTILARRGAQVTRLSIDEVREIFDVRAMLNGLRDRLIAENPDRARILPTLEAEIDALTRYARDAKRAEAYVDAVFRLNRILTDAAGSKRLRAILGSLALQTLRYSQLGLSTPERRRQSVQHWQKLLKAIRDGDGAAAERIARQRVIDSRDAAIRMLKEHDARQATPEKKTRRAA
ncbi:MAG TPA: GntR family transcriptional regulator [Burkholderiales bacterium]|nr:GntR family transcriptional regulator [Burkholderiales bacterium]